MTLDIGYYRETLLARLPRLYAEQRTILARINAATVRDLFRYNPEVSLWEKRTLLEECIPCVERECREAGIDEMTLRKVGQTT